jgi:hypothetical protein
MADYSNSKPGPGAVYPNNALESSNTQTEPLLTATQLKQRFLFGLPLHSQIKDPITNKTQQINDQILNDIINGAVSQIEMEYKVDILPIKRRQKFPFDRSEYDQWGFFKLPYTPVSSVDRLTITPANGIDVYEIPKDWIETAHLIQGQVNIVPIGIGSVYQGLIGSTPANGAWFLSVLLFTNWLPAYWQFEYTTGYPDGKVPRVINEMIGCIATMEVLGMLGTTYAKATSYSLGIDGMSQSIGTPGPNLFQVRIEQLQQKYDKLGKRLRALYGNKIWSDVL